MYKIALKNIFQNKTRSALAIVGLSIAIIGLISLVSISAGITQSIEESFEDMTGVVVMEEDTFELNSRLDMELKNEIEAISGVTVASPIIEGMITTIDGEEPEPIMGPMLRGNIYGIDPNQEMERARGAPFKDNLERGIYLDSNTGDNILISKTVADEYEKTTGSRIKIDGESFTVIGIYETGATFLDMMYVMPIETARDMTGIDSDKTMTFYVGVEDPGITNEVAEKIEFRIEDVEAKSMTEYEDEIGDITAQIRSFFIVISLIAVIVGAIGILNTMLMSVMERTREFGVLKAMGWTKKDIMKLITTESILLGIIGGLIGTILGIGTAIMMERTALSFPIVVTPQLIIIAISLSIILGLIGGAYPAWKAAKLDPVDAIRTK
ncbi:MAG: ABC transporter permease [archaeon]